MNIRLSQIGVTAMVAAALVCGCIKDEPKNMECDILSARVDADYKNYFYGETQMSLENIASNERELVFTVKSLISLPHEVSVSFELTPGASISPGSGSKQDFTSGPVIYTVTSEDGAWSRQYSVIFREASLPATVLSFEHFEVEQSSIISSTSYHVFYEVDQAGTQHKIWSSGNAGVAIMNSGWTPDKFPTRSVPDGYRGCGVCLETQSAGSLGAMFGKPIAAGNLFIGRFIIDNVMLDPLRTTDFGTPIDREPVRVAGWYKYSPGAEFTDKSQQVVPGRTDEASIYAVFFRNTDENGAEVKLYGDNVLSSPYIVSKAQVASLPPTDTWTRFEMFFEGDRADAAVLASQGYSFTLVCSSSKDGASFEGAVGSTLYVDEIEVFFEE